MDTEDLVKVRTLRAFPWNCSAYEVGAELTMSSENAEIYAGAGLVEVVRNARAPKVGPQSGLVDRAVWSTRQYRPKRGC